MTPNHSFSPFTFSHLYIFKFSNSLSHLSPSAFHPISQKSKVAVKTPFSFLKDHVPVAGIAQEPRHKISISPGHFHLHICTSKSYTLLYSSLHSPLQSLQTIYRKPVVISSITTRSFFAPLACPRFYDEHNTARQVVPADLYDIRTAVPCLHQKLPFYRL